MAMETEVKRVTLVISKTGRIKIEGIDPMPKEMSLDKLPIKALKEMDAISILRYEGSFCIVIEYMGTYYQYCI